MTSVLATLALLAAIVLASRAIAARAAEELRRSSTVRTLVRLARWSELRPVRLAAWLVVFLFGGVAAANFLAANRLSWGLAANWAFGLSIAGGLAAGCWYGWRRFRVVQWRTVAWATAAAVIVVGFALTFMLSLPPSGSEDQLNPVEAASVVALISWIWIPLIALPIGLGVGLVAATIQRSRRPLAST